MHPRADRVAPTLTGQGRAIVEAIPDFDAFADKAAVIGRAHARHRVSASQYPDVAGSLLEALEAGDPQQDAPTRDAWATAHNLLAEAMLMAARGRG